MLIYMHPVHSFSLLFHILFSSTFYLIIPSPPVMDLQVQLSAIQNNNAVDKHPPIGSLIRSVENLRVV